MNSNFKEHLLQATNSQVAEETEVIQSLWSGYGQISRYLLDNDISKTVVVKAIELEAASQHPRGWNTNNSHNRKVKSYEVETHWYKHWNQQCSDASRVPQFIGAFSEGKNQWIILEDLDHQYPFRKSHLNIVELSACLKWLANFHITFLHQNPDGLWPIGTYWHLDTRPDEWKLIENQELKSKAKAIDDALNQCNFQTIVHGDAKLANFCFSNDESKVAAVDFQYVGGGCGMKDVAYFLGSCLSNEDLERNHEELLTIYFTSLKEAFDQRSFGFEFRDLENEWRQMYPVACTDFMRFMMGWMPSHQKINNYNRRMVKSVLSNI